MAKWGFLQWTLAVAASLVVATPAKAGVKTWNGEAADTLWSSGANWSPPGAPGAIDNVTFTNLSFTDLPFIDGGSANTVVDAGFSGGVNSLGFRNITGVHNLSLLAPLTVSGTSATDVAFLADDGQSAILFVGSGQADGAADVVYASIGGGALTVNNPNASLSVMQASATSGAHRATLDLGGLSSLTCVVSNVLVGHDFGVPITRPTGTLFLAASNGITAQLISVGDAYQNAGAISFIHLGQANTLNVDRIRIALHKCLGTVDVTPGLDAPWVTFRNRAGTGRQVSWEIGDEYEPDTTLGFYTSNQSTGILDLTGATVDALVDRITLGRGQTNAATRTGDGNGTLTFGGGSINVNVLEMGIQLSDGGSAGRGTLNVNNDSGASPASLIVNGNVVMAVQLPGNTEATGSTAEINLNGGIMSVGGEILNGAGLSTININAGSTLDLKPTGDDSPGNVSVDVLNLSDGSLINYATLSASKITLAGSTTEFTVLAGQTLVPVAVGSIGTLDVTGDLTLRGTVEMDIRKSGGALTADKITVSGVINLGGTLRVDLLGNGVLAAGDKFALFSAATLANSFATVSLPPPGPGLSWTNKTAIDGTIEVIASGEPATPPTITITRSATSITMSWPVAYTSFVLRGQTNPPAIGLGGDWGFVPGVVANQITLPLNSGDGSVFYQLLQR